MNRGLPIWFRAMIIFALFTPPLQAQVITNAFTYQGQLIQGGVPADGPYDFRFQLFDDLSAGAQIGPTLFINDLAVNNGAFTTVLDFGPGAFNGQRRWLQIAVRPGATLDPYTALLPRQEVTAIPYALFALTSVSSFSTTALWSFPVSTTAPTTGQVLTWNGSQWAPATLDLGGGGGPQVTSITDVTGGLLVVGDIIDIAGSNLADIEAAFVGGIRAPVISAASGVVRVQIPEGVRAGRNDVVIGELHGPGFAGAVDVHRLGVFLGQAFGRIVILDTNNNQVVTSIAQVISNLAAPLCPAFANNGSLAFVPTGSAGVVIDMTANPPIVVDNPNGTQNIGFDVSPDGITVISGDRSGNFLRRFVINDFFPPYSDPVSNVTGFAFAPSTFPRCPAFLNNRYIAVPVEGPDEVQIIERLVNGFSDTLIRLYQGGIANPVQIRVLPEQSRFITFGFDDRVLIHRFGSLEFESETAQSYDPGNITAFDISPDHRFLYHTDTDSIDRTITTVSIKETGLTFLADSEDQTSSLAMKSLAVDPVEGRFLYVGLDSPPGDFLDFYLIENGASLFRIDLTGVIPANLLDDFDNCIGIGIQP